MLCSRRETSITQLKTMPILNDIIELKESLEFSKKTKKLKFNVANPFQKIKLRFDHFDKVLHAQDFDICDPRECNGKRITGTESNDLIFGSMNDDFIYTFPKDDEFATMDLFFGKDLVLAGDGFDNISGDIGPDSLHGGNGDDIIVGWKGDDFLNGGKGHDNLNDGAGDDTLKGGIGDDILGGGKRALAEIDEFGLLLMTTDNDYVDGGRGNDIIKALDGNDILIGGAGVDSFSIYNESIEGVPGYHIIRDFERDEVVMFLPNARRQLMPRAIEGFGRGSSRVVNSNGESLLVLEGVMPDEIHLNNDQIIFA